MLADADQVAAAGQAVDRVLAGRRIGRSRAAGAGLGVAQRHGRAHAGLEVEHHAVDRAAGRDGQGDLARLAGRPETERFGRHHPSERNPLPDRDQFANRIGRQRVYLPRQFVFLHGQ